MRKKILIGLGALMGLAALLLIVGIAVPADFRVSRTARMEAAPELVFEQVNDFHKWEAWSPWAKLDPQAENSFAGPEAGEGAKFEWSGNDEVGAGSMRIVESQSPERIRIELVFVRPMADTSDTLFTFEPEADHTKVTWTMSGKTNLLGKTICALMNMDKMVGGKFEEGLASMKKLVESQPAAQEALASESSATADN